MNIEILESHRTEIRKLQQKHKKSQYENNTIISKLNVKLMCPSSPVVTSVQRMTKKLKSKRNMKTHSSTVDKDAIKTKIYDTEVMIERLKEQEKNAIIKNQKLKTGKRFVHHSSKPSATKLKSENKTIRDSIKMKRVSLMITKNETTKLLADIEDEKANHIVRIKKFEQQLEVVNLQVRNFRYNFLHSSVIFYFSRDVIDEQSNIRQEAYLETKLKAERFRSEEKVRQLKEESRILRNKTISLESTFYPIVEEIEEKINQQNFIMEKYKTDFSKLSKANDILIKIYAKTSKMAQFLIEFNKAKAKDVHKMRIVERQQRFRKYLVDHQGKSFANDIKEESYSIFHRRTPVLQISKVIDKVLD